MDGDHHIEQEQKPRARIIAEYLAHGYVISDKAIESALAADKQNGYSAKFMQALQNFDSKTQASQKAQAVDNKLGITQKGTAVWNGLYSYYDKAANTPTGQKMRAFYDQGNKTVMVSRPGTLQAKVHTDAYTSRTYTTRLVTWPI
jgi:hypothetical protein